LVFSGTIKVKKNPIFSVYLGPEELRDRIFKPVSLSKKSDPSVLRDKLFQKIGFLSQCRSQKNPIPQFFGTSFFKKSDF
jgi:hypothetical protein